jgi:thiamine-phosphate pyrophosphorylase
MIVISNPTSIPNENTIINELFQNGLSLFHVRKPNYDLAEMNFFISQISPLFRSQLVLHSHHQWAKKWGINRIHFTQKARCEICNAPLKLLRPIRNPFKKIAQKGFHLSTSVHDVATFNTLENAFEYAFLSPVFASISKVNYLPKLDFSLELKNRSNFKTQLIALGGITAQNCQQALAMNFDDFALLGTVWNAQNPIQNFKLCQQNAPLY